MSIQDKENRYCGTEYMVISARICSFLLFLVCASACSSGSSADQQASAESAAGQGVSGQGSTAGQGTAASGGVVSSGTGGGVTATSAGANAAGTGVKAGSGASQAGAGGKGGNGGTGPSAGTATGSGGAGPSDTSSPFGNVKVEDLGKDGPYATTTTESTGPDSNYTIYHPQELGKNGVKHPVLAWTSGGTTTHAMYPVLPHLATHGFVIISSNTIPMPGAQAALGQEMVAGIDFVLAENEKSGSAFFGKIDSTKVAAMGYSMGGLATTTIVGDPRLTTTVHVSGGTGSQGGIEKYNEMHAPAAFLCGGTTGDSAVDIAGDNCKLDFDYITTQSVFYGKFNGDHFCSLLPPCQDWLAVAQTGWLRWQLMNDLPLKSMFVGSDCTVCKDSNWTVQQKNMK